jgi:TolB-like protein/tetratricopeptide (TPR) repeat protein
MGVVYLAEDEHLHRRVALKLLKSDPNDSQSHARLIREARTAAGVSHPLICQVFELGDWRGQPFVAMELLVGEALTARVARGALPSGEALSIAASILDALAVLHARGIVHRDLKPSNVFLTPHGIKLLDFGLARPHAAAALETTQEQTQQGMFSGTPQYAAPEQLLGHPVDARADLFAVGVVLFEMLTGRPPFTGSTLAALVHAVVHEAPPVLTGSSAVAAADRILCRALAKDPGQRYADAGSFATDLRAAMTLSDGGAVSEARRILRLAVLPFRLLKPDPEYDYLGLSLADALVSSLSGLESLVIRSALQSARYAGTLPDLRDVASELAVDLVLTGSMLRAKDRFRISVELLSVPAGDGMWRQTMQVAEDEIFDLQDEIVRGVMASLPLTAGDRSRKAQGRPASAKAYELYLRGMQLRMESGSWRQALALFEQCLELDPAYAPAWAERGRLNRVLAKYGEPALLSQAEASLERALTLDPAIASAHHYRAQLDIDLGRLEGALARLLPRVRERRAEPQLYAALAHACRYAGLLDESVAAHEQAVRLDPLVPSSVLHTWYMRGEYAKAVEAAHRGSDPLEARALAAMGRVDEAVAACLREEARFAAFPVMQSFCAGLRLALEGRRDEAVGRLASIVESGFGDGEGLFYIAGDYAAIGRLAEAEATLRRAIDAGFLCLPAFERDPYLAPLHAAGLTRDVLAQLSVRRAVVVSTFDALGGPELLRRV